MANVTKSSITDKKIVCLHQGTNFAMELKEKFTVATCKILLMGDEFRIDLVQLAQRNL